MNMLANIGMTRSSGAFPLGDFGLCDLGFVVL